MSIVVKVMTTELSGTTCILIWTSFTQSTTVAPQLGFIFEQVGRLGLHLVEGELINGVGKMVDGFGIPSSRTE